MVVRRVVAGGAAVVVLALPVPAVAAPPGGCAQTPAPGAALKAEPWESVGYGAARLAPLATGAGVRVAVVDSGVDDRHPQLRGRVLPGRDFLHGGPDGRRDCVGHGTGVAGLIAGRVSAGVPFRGLAPGARIVPVRVSEQQEVDGKETGARAGQDVFAEAIRWAADPRRGDADVINLSLVVYGRDARVASAVAYALGQGVVVVAAAGNRAGLQTAENAAEMRPFPAAYDGVIGVGSVGASGQRVDSSQSGDYVDLVAAGGQVTVPAVGGGFATVDGTSFAAPFVAATAALLRERFPDDSPAMVERRLKASADPAPGGRRSPGYGYGLLNPYRALTEALPPARRVPPPEPVVRGEDPAVAALRERRVQARDRSLRFAAAGLGLAAVGGIVFTVIRQGRRRRRVVRGAARG